MFSFDTAGCTNAVIAFYISINEISVQTQAKLSVSQNYSYGSSSFIPVRKNDVVKVGFSTGTTNTVPSSHLSFYYKK